jgi:hypothetical protein
MGRVDATVRGTTVSLRAEGMTGKVSVNDDNEVILSSGDDELVFQALSLGFNAYKATLQDAGTWRANIGQHDYLYRDVSTDGQLWSVRESRKRGRYIWYMGELGRAQVAVRGAKITISGQNVHATIDMGPKGDPVLRFFTAPGGMQIGEHVLHPGSAGQLCYQATTRHHRGR